MFIGKGRAAYSELGKRGLNGFIYVDRFSTVPRKEHALFLETIVGV